VARSKWGLVSKKFESYQKFQDAIKQLFKPDLFKSTIESLYNSPIARKLDYLAVDIYEPFLMTEMMSGLSTYPPWWEWECDPEIYSSFIRAYNDGNTDLPLYLLENSIAYQQPRDGIANPRSDGMNREKYLKNYFLEVIRCMNEGIPIKGFLFWMLIDNYEWGSFEPRLGLYNYDYVKGQIMDTDGLGEPAGKIFAEIVTALKSGNKNKISAALKI